MKILRITDGAGWAIDKLSQATVDYNPQFDWTTLRVHPKEVVKHLPEIEACIQEADIIWWCYFRIGTQVAELLPTLISEKINVLTHHNQKDKAVEMDQKWVNQFICHTEKMKEKLQKRYPDIPVEIIRHGIDLDFFDYDGNSYPPSGPFTCGYVGRTKPWKRLADISRVCRDLGVDLVGMGRRDDSYADQVDWEHIDWHENIPDDDRINVYRKMHCFIQYSEDGLEEGPMPLLEAMASGIPVITSPVGEARDIIIDEKNGLVVQNDAELKDSIRRLMGDQKLCQRLRSNAWETVKSFNEPNMAWQHRKLFNKVFHSEPLVSIVIPTYKRAHLLHDIVRSIINQTYPAIEIIIVDDDPDCSAREEVEKLKKQT